ncbi:MAG TPA: cyclopropane-fatty-acyl-phospholipid synthase family protein [Alphaproteobacteria bacterium]|nr:cyclopropane-fatty-acyl-phospholipid synthase family protein [Alphaproteobacteria bacterium]
MLLGHLLGRVIRSGTLKVIDARGRSHSFGEPDGRVIAIRLHDPALHYKLFFHPSLYLGEAFMDGTLTIEEGDLYGLLDLILSNMERVESHPLQLHYQGLQRLLRPLRTFNPKRRARRNAAHHYDLSGRLYDLFLDRDRQYSCAYFSSGNESLDVAQENKKRHIASKLRLKPGLRILDIGSGWGGLALTLARFSEGAKVTGITLSDEQLKVSRERAAKAGLSNRVDFALRDYRDMRGQFDRIVSVGMFEHVGPNHYGEFFAKVKELLSDDGICLLHSIGRMEPPGGTSPWLRKYIFPGGYTPALSEVLTAVEKVGLWVTDIEILRLHYAKTLREWRRRFLAHRDEALRLYDERFCRMWEFYLTSCEVAFRYLRQMVVQMQLAKHVDTVPLTRDYMLDWEREHANAHGLSAAAQA